jgi:hypothetical protein
MTNTNTTTTKPRRGPTPKRGRSEWASLIIRHHGNIKQIAAALGVTRNTVMKGIAREGLQSDLDLARRGWSVEVPEVEPAAAAAYPLVEVMTATRAMLGERLARGERPAVLQWITFVRGLNVLGALRPVDHAAAGGVAPVPQWANAQTVPLDPGVIIALRAGRVTPDEIIAGYGNEANGAIFEALVTVKPADLLRGLQRAQREYPAMLITDYADVLRACYVDVVDGVPMLSPKRSRS